MSAQQVEQFEPLIDADEVGRIFGMEPYQVRRLAREKRIPFVRIGRYMRFRPSEVEAFLAARHVDAVP